MTETGNRAPAGGLKNFAATENAVTLQKARTDVFDMEFLEREEHLRRLAGALAQAAVGRGQIIAISGEAGAGKTTLIERFARDQAANARVYAGACENLATPEPLLPLRDIVRAGKAALDLSEGHVAAFEALLRLLNDGVGPALLILEDVHWADAGTLDMIRFLGRRVAKAKALVLATYRDDEISARSPLRDVLGEAPPGSVQRMALNALSLQAVQALAEKAGRSGEELFRLTEGNPFLVTETLAVDADATSDTVRDATLARAARLAPGARALLDVASVFPRRAPIAFVENLIEGNLGSALDDCVERGMLNIDGDALRFRHELARRAIETSLPPSLRRSLHQRVVRLLQAAPDARASEIAHHAELAGDIPALLECAARAGEQAAREGAAREAAQHFASMLRHRDGLGRQQTLETLEQHAEQSYLMGDAETAVELMREAAQMRRAAGDTLGLARDLTRLTRYSWICGRRDDAESYVSEAIRVLSPLGETPELAWAYSHQSQLDMLAAKEDDAIRWGERALQMAEPFGAQDIIVHALGNVGTAKIQRDGLKHSPELDRSFELACAEGLHDDVERASCNLTCAAYWNRDHERVFEYVQRGVAYAAERDLVHWEGYLIGWRALALLDRGEYDEAEADAQRVCSWRGIPYLYRTPALFALARLRVRRGDPDADIPLEEARRLTEPLGELQRDVYTATIDAERLWLTRSVSDDGEERRTRALTHRETRVMSQLRAVHQRAVDRKLQWAIDDTALWLCLLGEHTTAPLSHPFKEGCQRQWRQAAEGWAKLGFPYEQALALSEGDEDAQREALTIFDRLGAAPAAARRRRLMRAAGMRAVPRGPNSGTRANPIGLTQRQLQVLELIGEGLSNPEIADRLCISAKTAEHHVSAIMARLDVASRREASAAARKLGLMDP